MHVTCESHGKAGLVTSNHFILIRNFGTSMSIKGIYITYVNYQFYGFLDVLKISISAMMLVVLN